MNNKKTFDSKTAMKLINEYAEKINILSRENNTLKKQLEDAQTSLKLNKEILYNYFSKKITNNNCTLLLNDLKKENERLTNKISWLFTEKAETSKQLYKLQQKLEDKLKNENDLKEKEKNITFIEENKLKEKENQITLLNKAISFYKKKGFNYKEIFIGSPNKINTEMNNELVTSRALIKKYSAIIHQEKLNNTKLKENIKELEEKIKNINLNTNLNSNKTNMTTANNIDVMDIIFTQNNNEDDNIDDDSIDNESIDSNNIVDNDNNDIQFPNNIETKPINIKNNQNNKIPKLDLSGLIGKYKKPDNLKILMNNKKSNRSENGEIVNKLKAQIKIFKQSIIKYKERIKKLKEQIVTLRNKNNILQNSIKSLKFNEKMIGEKDASMITENNISIVESNKIYKEINEEQHGLGLIKKENFSNDLENIKIKE